MPSHTISVLVENEFGVLARVAGLFSGRGFNIESLTVNEDPLDPTVSRIVLVATGDDQILEQINKQLNKLVSVIKVTDFKDVETVDREMVMVKVAVDERTRSELDSIVTAFRAHVVDIGPRAVTVELTGDDEKIKAFIALVRPLGIKEIVRSGKIAMARAVQLSTTITSHRARELNSPTANKFRENIAMKVYYDRDADLSALAAKKIAIIGFGSQGHAHALNLRDSGMDVRVGLRKDSRLVRKGRQAGPARCSTPPRPRSAADIIMMLVPDEMGGEIYEAEIAPHLTKGKYLAFGHGFNIHFKFIKPPADVNVFMIAPKGPGHLVRSEYVKGRGVPCLLAVAAGSVGRHRKDRPRLWLRRSAAAARRLSKPAFSEETETDLFGEQSVLCGGLTELIRAGYETLVEAGYAPEMAYFECAARGEADRRSDLRGRHLEHALLDQQHRRVRRYDARQEGGRRRLRAQAMKQILADIQSGKFANEWIAEYRAGLPHFRELRKEAEKHPVEEVGRKLRSFMPWLASDRLVDKAKN